MKLTCTRKFKRIHRLKNPNWIESIEDTNGNIVNLGVNAKGHLVRLDPEKPSKYVVHYKLIGDQLIRLI